MINLVWFIKNEFILAKESMKKYICTVKKKKKKREEISLHFLNIINSPDFHILYAETSSELKCYANTVVSDVKVGTFFKEEINPFLKLVMLKHLNVYLFLQLYNKGTSQI